eukprot:CAMPEP_0198240992 /NCGR_PEP_ID=MMETSP1446-20131203/5947_1 /TAXON_ID=1461542 ORGANISM="Unidentified sp, Strain CCMP2111" /NCGR_SAMPLE_ID=MMETSP1446 /ASSEMBLY_ACC=CAM_ASM_001112 /LENGTH=210 /DNA_ID=CAMNT_0043923789 /DNA_START=109 /DNA_END=741 /DNA_ORIENTATION=-
MMKMMMKLMMKVPSGSCGSKVCKLGCPSFIARSGIFARTVSSQLHVGFVTEKTARFTQEDVDAFCALTGDANPIHKALLDCTHTGTSLGERSLQSLQTKENERSDGVEQRQQSAIVPGLLCASLFPAIIGSSYPGTLYLGQTLHFVRKVFVGDAVTAKVRVASVEGRRVTFETQCFKTNGHRQGNGMATEEDAHPLVIDGTASALAPRKT